MISFKQFLLEMPHIAGVIQGEKFFVDLEFEFIDKEILDENPHLKKVNDRINTLDEDDDNFHPLPEIGEEDRELLKLFLAPAEFTNLLSQTLTGIDLLKIYRKIKINNVGPLLLAKLKAKILDWVESALKIGKTILTFKSGKPEIIFNPEELNALLTTLVQSTNLEKNNFYITLKRYFISETGEIDEDRKKIFWDDLVTFIKVQQETLMDLIAHQKQLSSHGS